MNLPNAYFFVERRVLSRPGVSVYAEWMFHGLGRRYGAAYPGYEYRYGEKLCHPLSVTKNVYNIADVFRPGRSWVVSARVRDLLSSLPHVDFLRVRFEKVFSIGYGLDEQPEWFLDEKFDEEDAFDQFDHDERLAEAMGDWFEMIIPLHRQFAGRFSKAKRRYSIPRELTSSPLRIELSMNMLEKYPIFWKDGVFLRDDVFWSIAECVDDRFFVCSRVPLAGDREQ